MTNSPEKGDPAPEISLPATDDQTVNLGRPAGKGQVLFFYPKDNTKGCTTEAKDFSALKDQFSAAGYDIIGISRDSLESHAKFKEKQDLSVTLASDENGDATEAYGVWVEKKMYGKTFMGIQRSTFVILADGTIGSVWRKVRVNGHAQQVLDQIKGINEE